LELENNHGRAHEETMTPGGQRGVHPVNVIGGKHPLGAFGTRRVCKTYDGPAINVVNPRTSVATDIMFLHGGDIDRAALHAAMQGANYLEVSSVYDQCGQNHLFQEVSENRPVITANITLGASVPIIFDGSKQGKVTDKFLNIPGSLATVDRQPVAQVAVASFRDTAQAQGISTLDRTGQKLSWGYSPTGDFFFATIANRNVALANPAPVTPFIAGFGNTPEGTMAWLDDAVNVTKHKYRGAVSGGTVGRLWSKPGGYLELSCLLIYGRLFQPADRVNANLSLRRCFSIVPHPGPVLLCDGDSITEGYGSTLNQTYPRQLMSMLKQPFRIYNSGSFGQKSKHRLSYLEKRWSKFFPDPNGENILVEYSGVNDLSAGHAAAGIYQNLSAIVAQGTAAGVKVILVTIPPSRGFKTGGTPPGQLETERLALNALIRDNAARAHGIADVASHPQMGSYENLRVKDYFFDLIHPAPLGLQHIAEVVAAAIDALAPAAP
jgi:lysophospholipase L1-like esterase